jgi:HSP20 family protein
MAEVAVKKQPAKEQGELAPWWRGWDFPLVRGSLFHVNPFALMRQFTEEMDRAFGALRGAGEWAPAIEVQEKDGKLCVTAEIPGVKKEDIKVNIANSTLTIEGERKHEKEEKREGYYHSERSYGKFLRSIALPEGAETDKATAQLKDGVLEVTVPVPEAKEKAKQIPVQ